MPSEKEKMLSGLAYKASDSQLLGARQHARGLNHQINQLHPSALEERNDLVKRLVGSVGQNFHIEPPFFCDYGYNITIGDDFYANYNCTILDCAAVTIGNNVFLAPNVAVYTAGHPVHFVPRNEGWEYAFPITIGNNVWIGGNTVINPGVTIGDNTVIASGSTVTKDIPANVVAAGAPCKVIRAIADEERHYYYRNLRL